MNAHNVSEQLRLLPDYLGHHLALTLLALTVGIVVCIPLGALITRVKPLQWPTLTIAGILQTIPGLALLALMVPLLGTIGFVPAVAALILYSFLPILRNTVTGILGVDASVKEAARGIGMTDRQMLFGVELPLALPVIVAGVRTAAVWIVGTATLATPVGATSLGNYIFSGLQTQNLTAVLVGCVAAAALAIVIDQLIHRLELAVARRSGKRALVVLAVIVVLAGAGMAPLVSGSFGSGDRTVVIGSKPFTEQYILAEVMSDVVESGGFQPDTRPGMGSIVLFEALAAGDIDCYVDYSGTIWTNVMQRVDMLPRALVVREMTRWLDSAHGIVCLGALGFENTYALAVRRETAEQYDLTSLSDLAKVSAALTMGSDYEFYARPEWQALREKYGLEFKELRTFDPSLMYSAVGQGDVDVISAYSTDGRIVDFDLVTLADPLQALPPYDAVLLLSRAASTRPGLRPQLETLVGAISDEMMREANRLVDQGGASPDSAASDLLSRSPVSPPNPIQ